MTDSVTANTRRASFKGAPFFITKIETEEGVLRAKYLFLNSKRRKQKAFGKFPPVFTVTGFTHAIKNDEYVLNKNRLREALSSDVGGLLVHPFEGNVYCTCKGTYKYVENLKRTNVCDFSITFENVDSGAASPSVIQGLSITSSGIAEKSIEANRLLQSASASLFTSSTPENIDVSKSLFDNAGSSLGETFASIGETIQKISDYTGDALKIQQQAQFYADNPLVGFAAIADSIFGIDGLTTDVFAKFKACQNLFNWGEVGTDFDVNVSSPSNIDPNPLTVQAAEKLRLSDSMKKFMQCAGCLEAYTQSGAATYSNSDEIDAVIEITERQFDVIKNSITFDESLPVNIATVDYSEFYDSLNSLRVDVLGFLAQQRTQTATIEEITVIQTPASVLAYRLYGDSSRAEEILTINGLTDNMAVSGKILVYSK